MKIFLQFIKLGIREYTAVLSEKKLDMFTSFR
ncbi:hypothetical protein ABIE11_003277 [Lelliottia sp. 489]